MTDQVITKQELIDAQKDAQTLEDAVNGEPGKLIKSRTGREFYSLASVPQINTMTREEVTAAVAPKANDAEVYKKTETLTKEETNALVAPKANQADVDNAISGMNSTLNTSLSNLSTTANKYYSTLAAANANIANIALNQSVTIGEAANSGLWYKATAGATSLTKSPYDPLTQAHTYTDNKVKSVTNNFKTKALMESSTLPNDSYASVTDDLEPNNGLYVKNAGAWVKSLYYIPSVLYEYINGGKVAVDSLVINSYGINYQKRLVNDSFYKAYEIPVSEGDILYLYNSFEKYYPDSGFSFGFTDKSIRSVGGASMDLLPDDRVDVWHTDGKNYAKVTVPKGAMFGYFNTNFTNSFPDWVQSVTWSISDTEFTTSATTGDKRIHSINNVPTRKSLKQQAISDISYGSDTEGNIYSSINIMPNYFVSYTYEGIGSTEPSQNWIIGSLSVKEGVTYYVVTKDPVSFPAAFIYSKGSSGTAPAYSGEANRAVIGENAVILENGKYLYQFTVPEGVGITHVFMNLRIVDETNYSLDIRDTLEIYEGTYTPELSESSRSVISSIGGIPLVDAIARARLDKLNNKKSKYVDTKFFALGDSITEGTKGGYVMYLSAALQTNVTNMGSSGGTAQRVVDIITAGAGFARRDSATAQITWATPDFTDLAGVTLMIGTNHLDDQNIGVLADIPTQSFDDYVNKNEYWDLFPNNFIGNLAFIFEYLRWKATDVDIYVITPPYDGTETTTVNRVDRIVDLTAQVAKHYAVKIIYATYETGISAKEMRGARNIYSYDGIHFNELGNKVFGEYVSKAILSKS